MCIFRIIKRKRDAYVSRLNQIYRNNLDKVGCNKLLLNQQMKYEVKCNL